MLVVAFSCVPRLQKMVREIEQLGAMKSQIVSPHSIEVEFLYKHVSSLSLEVTDSDEENLTLKVTLTFKEDNLGSLHLAGVKVRALAALLHLVQNEKRYCRDERMKSCFKTLCHRLKILLFEHLYK